MSDVQQAIEELVAEQVESRIDDAIADNWTINDIRSDIDDLQSKSGDEVVEEVTKQVVIKLVGSIDNGAYTFIKKSEINALHDKIKELASKLESKDVA